MRFIVLQRLSDMNRLAPFFFSGLINLSGIHLSVWGRGLWQVRMYSSGFLQVNCRQTRLNDINFFCWAYKKTKKKTIVDKLVTGVEIGRCPLSSLCKIPVMLVFICVMNLWMDVARHWFCLLTLSCYKKTSNWDKLVIGVEIGRCPLKSLCKKP